ncbi:hypothetical protein GCM10025779_29140 [Arthrobacter cryoconiti]
MVAAYEISYAATILARRHSPRALRTSGLAACRLAARSHGNADTCAEQDQGAQSQGKDGSSRGGEIPRTILQERIRAKHLDVSHS